MCSSNCLIFGINTIIKQEIEGKRVIEVGSHYFNGSLRPIVEFLSPREYIGVDIERGRGVDIVCNAEDILEKFGENSFDTVISTELLEHVVNWKKVVSNLKHICRPEGTIIITTRSKGFPYHAYPYDFWRYEADDMNCIFGDCIIEKMETDTRRTPGVFVKIKKPHDFREKDLSHYELFSIILGKKSVEPPTDEEQQIFQKTYLRKRKLARKWRKINKFVVSLINSM